MEVTVKDIKTMIGESNTEASESFELLLSEYFNVDREIKALEEQKRVLSTTIKQTVRHNGGTLTAGEFEAKVVDVAPRKTIDLDAALSKLGEWALAPFIKIGEPSEKLSVKKI
jgi:hypothetical protein